MLFPGQGSQAVGMGADLVATYPAARALFAKRPAGLERAESALLAVLVRSPNAPAPRSSRSNVLRLKLLRGLFVP